ncbi:MAG: hypothetical protein ACSHX3_16865 [Litorimonas sp.]
MTFQVDAPKADEALSRLLKRLAAAVAFVLTVVILVLTLSPSVPEITRGINDKILHFTAFTALVLPCAIFLARNLVWIVPLAVMFGGAIEFIQPGLGREASWADVLAGGCGVASGAIIGLMLRPLIKRYVAAPKHGSHV